jgi:hypothetical protein
VGRLLTERHRCRVGGSVRIAWEVTVSEDPTPEVAPETDQPAPQPASRDWIAWVVIGLVIAVAVMVGIGLAGRSPEASASPPETVPPSQVPSAALSPSASADAHPSIGSGVGVDWTTVATFPGASVNDVTAGGPGWVAVGTAGPISPCMGECAPDIYSGRIWSSSDGRAWAEVPVPGLEAASLLAVTDGPEGLVAIGWQAGEDGVIDALVLTSADGGTWGPIDDAALSPGAMLSGIVGGPSYVITGSVTRTDGNSRPGIWTSMNGRDWEERLSDAGEVGAIHEVTLAEQTWIAVGYIDPTAGAAPPASPFEPTAWRSSDTATWTPVALALDPSATGGWSDTVLGTEVGVIAAGYAEYPPSDADPQYGFATWRSADGSAWDAAPVTPGTEEGLVLERVLYEAAGRIFAIGAFAPYGDSPGDTGMWWTTEDGLTWVLHSEDPPYLRAVTSFGGGLIAAGIEDGAGAIFLSE